MDKLSYIANSEATYIEKLYDSYQQDAGSVDIGWQKFFEGFDFSQKFNPTNGHQNGHAPVAPPADGMIDSLHASKELEIVHLIRGYRSRGHLLAKTNPIRTRKDRNARLELADFKLTEKDLDTTFNAGTEVFGRPATLREIVTALQKVYTGRIGYEYLYIRDRETKNWLRDKIEKEALYFEPSIEEKKHILSKLNEAVVFENFLHTKFLGQKRFSLEGGETTIPAMDAMINRAADLGVEEVVIGMAHRGRLNILANIMQKTYENIFNEFAGANAGDTFGEGDVKYHMGFTSKIETPNGKEIGLKLAPNPSHLEAVNPVVEGLVRARADIMFDSDYDKVLPVLIHGDAAVAAQGIVYEVTQMSNLEGYYTGGTIHFVINNQIGFTTDFDDARSSIYCTDVAKIVDAPVLHVNGDDPEAVVYCMQVAVEFRQKFNRDIFVDMVCYRRWGHNEADEPKFTQPLMYKFIEKHPTPREIYNAELTAAGDVSSELAKQMDAELRQMLQDRLDKVKQKELPYKPARLESDWRSLRRAEPVDFDRSPVTAIALETLQKIGRALVATPQGFKMLKQIETLLKDRHKMIFETGQINWGTAELLAYGSLLLEKRNVRLSGQDVQRGTFSHRQSVLHDVDTNAVHNSLDHIEAGQGKFMVYNSLLSEYGVLGFEYGYAMADPSTLVIWEAQFGDFANGAQVMIDQFVAAGETKWQRQNGLVMLLPHGYEGQGPEHSNARPERFLQLAADYNLVVANVTSPANYFHLLRRQLAWEFRKPLVVMTPKSLLRDKLVVSNVAELTQGGFREVLPDQFANPKKVRKVLLCSGKIAIDLIKNQQGLDDKGNAIEGANPIDDVAVVRIEQLYPFPEKQVLAEIAKYKKGVEVCWVQEEPANMGAYTFLLREFAASRTMKAYMRKASASPSTGFAARHKDEQTDLIARSFA